MLPKNAVLVVESCILPLAVVLPEGADQLELLPHDRVSYRVQVCSQNRARITTDPWILDTVQGYQLELEVYSHFVNSHFVNSYFVNSHLVNFPLRQFPLSQFPFGQC